MEEKETFLAIIDMNAFYNLRLSLGCCLAFMLLSSSLYAQLTFSWANTAGAGPRDEITALSRDAAGNVFATGVFQDSVELFSGSDETWVKGGGWKDILLVKYGPDGQRLWSHGFGDAAWDRGWSLTTDPQGNVYTGGVFSRSVDFDPGPDSTILTSNQAGFWPDGYLAKYDTDGNLLWANHLLTARPQGTSQTATLLSIADMEIDADGNLIIGGALWDSAWFDASTLLVGGTLADPFLAKYDADGKLLWAQLMAGSGDNRIQSLAVDTQNRIYVSGFFFGAPDMDPGSGTTTLSSQGQEDIFLAAYQPDGSFSWAKAFGSSLGAAVRVESGRSVDVDSLGNVYLTGLIYGDTDFNPGGSGGQITPTAGTQAFVVKHDAAGAFQWVFSIHGTSTSYQIGTAITVLPSGDFFLGGEYESGVGGLDLDPSADSALIYSNSPGSDLFVGKYTADGAYLEGWGVRGTQPDYLVDMDAGGDELVIGGYFTSFLLVDQQGGDLRFGKGAEDGYIIKYAPESTPIESSLNPMEVQLFPNPAREAVSLKFELSKAQIMDIGLYDQAGKRVQLIQQGYWMQPGPYELEIRLRADLVPGMYVLRLQTAQGQVAKKILLQ